MRKFDDRGAAAFEFALVAVPFFTLMFVVFDLGRYAITVQSLRALANDEARAIMIGCYTTALTSNPKGSPCGCTSDTMSATQKQGKEPFLYDGGLTPAVSITCSSNALTIKATQPGFKMLMPVWGTKLNAPSVSASIPF